MEAVVENRVSGIVVIVLTVLTGMVLSVVPVPHSVPAELGFVRPDWVAMVLVYWILALPHRLGLISAWCIGIVMDILLGSLIGQHALSYVAIAYIVANLYQRLRMFSVWQQAAVLFAILGVNHLINFWVESIFGLNEWSMWYLLPAVSGALLWPWVFLMLRFLRRKFRVT
ncbi:MAG: rod shape-determining protein MreD [Gammaproteobacteria bacterium]|jgi:rod shape-determining protein MreD|nr:rod shape-determining protein MreD [Gammaproteobacteria bacterium]MBT4493382.1 rod shape-determining protein MreD [Gammaproteobacteria bacterium]MBT7370642.1 rod shape-determining protein MreD [Gammaproteobacteria bacterium]